MTEKPANHLLGSSSPYLAAHAHDPVQWRPWGREAFDVARELDRPILLSIGYQSCHWCHVMQRESFANTETAALVNENFVAIKLDRELRPDVDALYMSYVTMATGHGGWPMTVALTPELVPFFGGTYFPPEPGRGMPSFTEVLTGLSDAWRTRRDEVEKAGADALDAMRAATRPRPTLLPPGPQTAALAARQLLAIEDPVSGGIGGAPKFPQLPAAEFLLAYSAGTGDSDALAMVRRWVRALVRGGIYDHADGGIFRYATDAAWLVPHFEKMLYDNAQLLSVLAALHRLEPAEELAAAARATADFLVSRLAVSGADATAGFYSSLDAEADHVEGAPYVWRYDGLTQLLTTEELELAKRQLGVTPAGNWERTTILTRHEGRERDAEAVDALLAKLLAERDTRVQPQLITNVLADWNALAARGLLDAGDAFGDAHLTELGVQLVDFLAEKAVAGDSVNHDLGAGEARGTGAAGAAGAAGDAVELLTDAAAVTSALLAAIDLAGRDDLLGRAEAVFAATLARFEGDDGVLFETGADTELPVRPAHFDDAPTPSGTSLMLGNAIRLRTDDGELHARLVAPISGMMSEAPYMAGSALTAALEMS